MPIGHWPKFDVECSGVPNDFSQYISAYRERRTREQQLVSERALRARAAAEVAAEKLGMQLGVGRVFLFGSLARGTFSLRSDIDLAVEGLAAGMLVDALAVAEEHCAFSVDVLPLDAARPEVADAVRLEGIQLWPR